MFFSRKSSGHKLLVDFITYVVAYSSSAAGRRAGDLSKKFAESMIGYEYTEPLNHIGAFTIVPHAYIVMDSWQDCASTCQHLVNFAKLVGYRSILPLTFIIERPPPLQFEHLLYLARKHQYRGTSEVQLRHDFMPYDDKVVHMAAHTVRILIQQMKPVDIDEQATSDLQNLLRVSLLRKIFNNSNFILNELPEITSRTKELLSSIGK